MKVSRQLLAGAWLVGIAIWYFYYHTYFFEGFRNFALLIALVLSWGLLVGGTIGFFWKRNKTLNIRPLPVLGGFFILVWITGIILYAWMDLAVMTEANKIWFVDNGTQLAVAEEGVRLSEEPESFLQRGSILANWSEFQVLFPEEAKGWFTQLPVSFFAKNLLVSLGQAFGFWLFFTFLFHNLGAVVRRCRELTSVSFFKNIGAGMVIGMGAIFLLGLMGRLDPLYAWITAILFVVIGLVKFPLTLKWLWYAHERVSSEKGLIGGAVLSLMLGLTLGLNILTSMKPFPSGFDSLTLYHNTPRLLTQYGELISGIPLYNYELLMAWGQLLYGKTSASILMVLLGGFLGFGLLYITLKRKFSALNSLLLLTVFATLPMVVFMQSIDYKIDLPLLFFTLLAIHSGLEWWQVRREKPSSKEELYRLMATSFWLGIGFGIKFTQLNLILTFVGLLAFLEGGLWALAAVGLLGLGAMGIMGYSFPLESFSPTTQQFIEITLVVLGAVIGLTVIFKKRLKWAQLKTFLIVVGVSFATVMPWIVWHGWQTNSIQTADLLYGERAYLSVAEALPEVDASSCTAAYTYNELGLFTGKYEVHSILYPVVILWESSISSALPNERFTDISFLFLGFLLLTIFYWKARQDKTQEIKKIILLTLLYGIFWLLTSRNTIWYGMPLFVGAFVLYGEVWTKIRWTKVVVGVWLLLALMLRVDDSVVRTDALLYAGGVTDESIFIEQQLPGAEAISEAVNSGEAKNEDIYVAARYITYLIERNDTRVYLDNNNLLNDFACYFMNESPDVTLERLRKTGIGYIIVADDVLRVESDPSGPLHQQFEQFEIFAANFLEELVYRPHMALYKVPEE